MEFLICVVSVGVGFFARRILEGISISKRIGKEGVGRIYATIEKMPMFLREVSVT